MLKILESTYRAAPITMEKIAELLHVSVRTVRYDLELLEEEIREDGVQLQKKARKGIWLEHVAGAAVSSTCEKSGYIFSPKERCEQVIVELLDHPKCSIDELAENLGVSRNTLLSDLKAVQDILKRRNLTYDSKRGLGIWAEGGEQEIRDMLIHIFAKSIYDFRQYDEKCKGFIGMQRVFAKYAEGVPVQAIAAFFLEFMRTSGIQENDVPTNRMICALVVQIKRLQQGHPIQRENQIDFLPGEGEELEHAAGCIAAGLDRFAPEIATRTEVQCIMKEILHSRINFMAKEKRHSVLAMHMKALDLAREFIEYVQVWMGDVYLDDDELVYNLAMHLQPAIERARYGIILTNPLLVQIQTQYKELFAVSCKAAERLSRHMQIRLSDDEVGYLTIHLGAAVERRKSRRMKNLAVLLVCGNGVGTANLLAMTLKNHMPYIEIKKVLSLYRLEDEPLQDIDIIISTVSLEVPGKAVLRISPILTEAEIKIIEGQIRYFYDRKVLPRRSDNTMEQKPGLAVLLEEPLIALDEEAKDWEEAVRKAGNLLRQAGAVTSAYVECMVQRVKDIGPYIVVCPGVAMPHSRVEDGAEKVAISFLRLKKPVFFRGEKAEIPVDLLFAFSTTDESAHLGMMMDLWNLFTDKAALDFLRGCRTKEDVRKFVQQYS